MDKPVEVVALWTATGHLLTRIGPESDPSEERQIDDVIADDWIYRPARSVIVTERPPVTADPDPADRRCGVGVL